MNETIITTTGLMEILSQIEELSEYDISVTDNSNGDITISIGESTYNISPSETVSAPDEVVEEIADINDDVYETMDYSEDITSGLIKELVKTEMRATKSSISSETDTKIDVYDKFKRIKEAIREAKDIGNKSKLSRAIDSILSEAPINMNTRISTINQLKTNPYKRKECFCKRNKIPFYR